MFSNRREILEYFQSANPDEPLPQDLVNENMVAVPAIRGEEQIEGQNVETGRFIRIINLGQAFLPKSDIGFTCMAGDVAAMQELGLTPGLDESLTAKIIGTIGNYRFRVLKDQEQYGMRTDSFHEKEAICQHAIARVKALREVEKAYGAHPDEIAAALTCYQQKIKAQIANLLPLDLQEGIIDKTAAEIVQIVRVRFANDRRRRLDDSYYDSLLSDLAVAEQFAREVNTLQVNANPWSLVRGYDETKNPIENFVKARINQIIHQASKENELVTIAGKKTLFRGFLHDTLVDAAMLQVNFKFDQNQRITAKHQGDYSEHDLQKVTIQASKAIGTDKAQLRRFLLGASYILDNKNPLAKPDADFEMGVVRGWRRLFKREKHGGDIERYYLLRNATSKANISNWKLLIEDVEHIGDSVIGSIAHALRGAGTAFLAAAFKLYRDFVPTPEVQREPEIAGKKISALNPITKEIIFDHNAHHEYGHIEHIKAACDIYVREQEEQGICTERLRDSFNILIAQLEDQTKNENFAPLALPPSHLEQFSPRDIISKGIGGGEEFLNPFIALYLKNPSIAFYATLFYGIGVGAIARPELFVALSKTLKVNLGFVVQWNTVLGETMSHGLMSKMISAGFTNWQICFFLGDAMVSGLDSKCAGALTYLKEHFPTAAIGITAALGLGYSITHKVNIPFLSESLREEQGNVPYFTDFFAGLKLGLIAYESLHSSPHERSIFGNLLATVADLIVLPIRLAASIVALPYHIYKGQAGRSLIPWIEGTNKLINGGFTLIDAITRLTLMAGKGLKLIVKTIIETLLNGTANAVKLIASPIVEPQRNMIARGIIEFKQALYAFADRFVSRPIKNLLMSVRNFVARFKTRSDWQLHNQYCAWLEGRQLAPRAREQDLAQQVPVMVVPPAADAGMGVGLDEPLQVGLEGLAPKIFATTDIVAGIAAQPGPETSTSTVATGVVVALPEPESVQTKENAPSIENPLAMSFNLGGSFF